MGLIQQFQKAGALRRKEVATMAREVTARLGDFRKEDAERRREVAALKVEVAGMLADADAFVHDLHVVSAGRRKEVAAMRADADAFVGELHRLSAARHVEIWGGAAPAARAAAPLAAAPAKGAPATLRDVIFTYLAEHPDGAKLTQLERDLGMARIKLAQPMRGLIADKKVRKRGLVYFAV